METRNQLQLPAPAPQIIEVPAVITRRTTYVPDDSAWIDNLARSTADRYQIGIDDITYTGRPDRGSWSHEIRTTLSLTVPGGSDRAMSIYIWGSNNKRQRLRIVVGAFTFVCSNGLMIGDKRSEHIFRHTLHVRQRAQWALNETFESLPNIRQLELERERRAVETPFSIHRMHSLNYRGFLANAWSATTAKAIAKQIDHPEYAEFNRETVAGARERITTVLRDLEPAAKMPALAYLRGALNS